MNFGYNSTIGKKLKPCKSCGKPCYWFSKQRCQDCARIEDTMKRMEQENEKVIQEEDLGDLIADADAVFSQFIRLKYADRRGYLTCYTCVTYKHWTMMQCGHYISRKHLFLRYDERNCRPQDQFCNEHEHGNLKVFTEELEFESPGITEILREESLLVYKPTREEIRQIIAEYTPKVKSLKSKLKL